MSLPDWIRILAEIDRIIEASTQPFDANTIGNVRDLMGPLSGSIFNTLRIPSFSNRSKGVGEHRRFSQHSGEAFDQRQQAHVRHGWGQIVEHAALAEQ